MIEEPANGSGERRNHIREHLIARLNTKITVEKKGESVTGILSHIDPWMKWVEVEEKTEDGSRNHFINMHLVSDIIGISTDEVVMRRGK